MAKEFKVNVRLTGDSKDAERALKDTEKGHKDLTQTTKKTATGHKDLAKATDESEASHKSLTQTVKDNAAAFLAAAVAIFGAVKALAALARAAFDTETAVRKVEAAMKTAGDFSEAASVDMQAFAKGLQSVGTESDEAILSMIALAKGFVGTNEEAKKLVATALDFKEIAAIAFEESVRRIGRATGGSVEDIAKFDSRILDLTKTELANGEATRLLGEKYQGLNKAMSETAEGGVTKFQNVLQDLNAAFAKGVLDAAEFSDTIGELTKSMEGQVGAAESLGAVTALFIANTLKGQGPLLAAVNARRELKEITERAAAAELEAAAATDKKAAADTNAAAAAKLSKEEQDKLTEALKGQAEAYTAAVESAKLLGEVSSIELEGEILAITQALLDQKVILGEWTREYQNKAELAGEKIDLLRRRIASLKDGLGDLTEKTDEGGKAFVSYGRDADAAVGGVGRLATANDRLATTSDRVSAANDRLAASNRRVAITYTDPRTGITVRTGSRLTSPPGFQGSNQIPGGTFTTITPVRTDPNGRII